MIAPDYLYGVVLDALLHLLIVCPMTALREVDSIRDLKITTPISIWEQLSILRFWAVEAIGATGVNWLSNHREAIVVSSGRRVWICCCRKLFYVVQSGYNSVSGPFRYTDSRFTILRRQ